MFQAKRAVARLAAGGVANRIVATTNGLDMVLTQVVNAMVASGAAIDVNKLAHVGSGNVLRSDGTSNVAGKVRTDEITPGAISQAVVDQAGGATSTTSGSFVGTGQSITLSGITVGSKIIVFFIGGMQNSVVGHSMYWAIGVDTTTAAAAQTLAHAKVANQADAGIAGHVFTSTAVSHTLYALWTTSGGSLARAGLHTMIAVELKV